LEGAWFLAVPPSRMSAMLLMTLITAFFAWLIWRFTSKLGRATALMTSLLFLTSPLGMEGANFVNLDMLMALLCFAATWRFYLFLESLDWRDSLAFAIVASLAILTKYNALLLVLLPIFTLLVTRRFYLLRKWEFWLPVPVVMLIAGPWYLVNWHSIV